MAKILGVVGSLRERSHTRELMKITLDYVNEAGGEAKMLDLAAIPLPMLNTDDRGKACPELDKARGLVEWADAFLLGSPDYHGSMSGAMKNFLDHFWHEFTGKLFGYIVASHEKGLTVQDQMRTAVRQCYGWSLPYGIGFNGDVDMSPEGKILNERLDERAKMLAFDLIVYGNLIYTQFKADLLRDPRNPGFAKNFHH